MRRVASVCTAAAIACTLAGCGESRPLSAPIAGAGCSDCHSGPGEAPPFRDFTGSTDPGRITVGAHDAHLHPSITAPISCSECHTEPRTIGDPGHLENAPGDLRFGSLASAGGASPVYERPGCSAVYCHGNFAGGNTGNVTTWIGGDERQAACGTCHDIPPPTGRHAVHNGAVFEGVPLTCPTCHGSITQASHVNGVKNVALTAWNPEFRTCAAACHQARAWGQ